MKTSELLLLIVAGYVLYRAFQPPTGEQLLPLVGGTPPPGYYWGSDLTGNPTLLPIGAVS